MKHYRATSTLAAALAVDLVLLGTTGAWLAVRYRPDRPSLPDTAGRIELPHSSGALISQVHRWLAVAAVVLVGALVVLTLARVGRRPRHEALAMGAVLLVAVGIAAAYETGGRLPWSQVALSAVTIGGDFSGVWKAAFDPVVLFVVTGREVTKSDYQVWVLTHLFAAPAVAAAALGALGAQRQESGTFARWANRQDSSSERAGTQNLPPGTSTFGSERHFACIPQRWEDEERQAQGYKSDTGYDASWNRAC